MRIHHCIADGIALIAVSMSMVDGGSQPPEPEPKAEKRGGLMGGIEGAEDWIAGTFLKSFTRFAVKTLGKTGEGLVHSLEMLADPKQGMDNTVHMAKITYQLASDAAALVLPIGVENPIERVYEVRRRMGALKGSMQPLLAFGMLALAGTLIKPAQEAMLNLFSKKTTAVMTNVPGPIEKLKFCGSTLEQSLF